MACRFIPHATQVVGKMRIEDHAVVPFGMDWMQRVVGEGDDVLSKRRHIHGDEEGAQLLRGRRIPVLRPFIIVGTRHIGMLVSGRSDTWKGTGIA